MAGGRMRRCTILALLWSAAAGAHSITDEVIFNNTQATSANPRTNSLGNALHGNFDLTSDWALLAGAMLTYEGQTPGTASEFGTEASTVSLFMLGLEFLPTDHWVLGATFSGSPPSTLYAGTSFVGVNTQNVPVQVDALIHSESSELAASFDASYQTVGLSDLEWAFTGAVTFTHLDTTQNIARAHFPGANGTTVDLGPAGIRAACAAGRRNCVKGILTALDETPMPLDSQRLTGVATATVVRDTDLTLGFDWYHYNQDPASIGFFSLTQAGKAGLGVPIAPLHWLVRPEVQERFGPVSVRLWFQVGRYEPGTGESTSGIGMRAQYRFNQSWRVWLTATGQHDIDAGGDPTNSGGIALGGGYRW
jgi:hypothetical protein